MPQRSRSSTYDAAGLPVSSSDGTVFTHDAAGHLTAIDQPGTSSDWTYTYDPWGRMSRASGPEVIDYLHDALDCTVRRTEGSEVTDNAFVGTTEDLATVTVGGTTTLYAHGPNGPLAQKQGSATRFYLSDLHEDVVGMADTAGTLAGTLSFSPYGETRSATGEQATLGYQGDPTDPDTGLVDMLTRNYSPGLGRFTKRDVLFGNPKRPMTLNQYVYVEGSPMNWVDPTGRVMTPGGGGGCGDNCDVKPNQGSSHPTGGSWGEDWVPTNKQGTPPAIPKPAPPNQSVPHVFVELPIPDFDDVLRIRMPITDAMDPEELSRRAHKALEEYLDAKLAAMSSARTQEAVAVEGASPPRRTG